MSKRESTSRHHLIINKLRKNSASFQEISEKLALESEIQAYDFNVSKRTFQRDLNDIRSLYGVDVKYDRSGKVYYIDFDEHPEISERIIEAFDIFNALNISNRLSNHIHFLEDVYKFPKQIANFSEDFQIMVDELSKFLYENFYKSRSNRARSYFSFRSA